MQRAKLVGLYLGKQAIRLGHSLEDGLKTVGLWSKGTGNKVLVDSQVGDMEVKLLEKGMEKLLYLYIYCGFVQNDFTTRVFWEEGYCTSVNE